MPLSAAEKQQLLDDAATLTARINALVPDSDTENPIPPDPIPSGKKRPVVGNSHFHHQENWMADWIPEELIAGRAVPWTVGKDPENGILVPSLGGQIATRVQAWHLFGIPTELYSQTPYFDKEGRSHPYSPQTGDDFFYLVDWLNKAPTPGGERGFCAPTPYTTIIPHPTYTLSGNLIPRTPLAIWFDHNGRISVVYATGRVDILGFVPNAHHVTDACADGRGDSLARQTLYMCELGTGQGAIWTGGKIYKIDRGPGIVGPGGNPPEDPSKYVVTPIADVGYPSAVRSAEDGRLFWVDASTGHIYVKPLLREATILNTIPNAYAMDYNHINHWLYILARDGFTHIIDSVTGNTLRELAPPDSQLTGVVALGQDFWTISVDSNGTCGPAGTFSCSRVHKMGNANCWQYAPDFSCKLSNAIYGSGHGWNAVGEVSNVHEAFGHYDWLGGKFHVDQAIRFVGGYANTPVGIIVHNPVDSQGVVLPMGASVDYTAVWRGIRNISWGGASLNRNRPSLTCLLTREGWSPFKGCSNDEIAEMSFDEAATWIQGGYAGSFPRPDLTGVDLYCTLLNHLVNSQRHLKEGAILIQNFNQWYSQKFPNDPIPNPAATVVAMTPGYTTHKDPNGVDYRLEVRQSSTDSTSYSIGIFGSSSSDQRYGGVDYSSNPSIGPVPADASIIVDEGMETETIWTEGKKLEVGWHSFTVRAAGWATGACTYQTF